MGRKCAVVTGGHLESRRRKFAAQFRGEGAFSQSISDAGILLGARDNRDVSVVFRRRADHARPADVDVFDRFGHGDVGLGDGRFERVEIADDDLEGNDAVLADRLASSGRSGRPRMAPWTLGCSVFTLPSMISGNPVYDAMSITGTPCSSRNRRVPPVEMISNPRATRSLTNGPKSDLSLTLTSTRRG
jgi:hypothetical protein